MKTTLAFSLLLTSVLFTPAAWSQCATGVDTGGQCIPPDALPGAGESQQAQPQRPRVVWASRWGAIATDEPRGVLGVATNMDSQQEAEAMAMADCRAKGGGSQCKLEIWYSNQCAALTVSDKDYNTATGKTTEDATAKGMQICTSSGNAHCRTYYTTCSQSVQVQ